MVEGLAERVRAYIQQVRDVRGDVAMGCVRMEVQPNFVGIVYDKPGGSSAQFEASYDPDQGFTILSTGGELHVERDIDQVFQRFAAIIDEIPAQRRAAIEQRIAEWQSQGFQGVRLRALVMHFNIYYRGTRGGQLAPDEMGYATRLASAPVATVS